MKALSIKQPWASLIAYGIKDIENRTWRTNFRGKIYIHASAKSVGKMEELLNDEQYKFVKKSGWKPGTNKPLSAIIGQVDIIDCVINHPSIWAEKTPMNHYPIPKDKKIYNWVLANPVLYDKPILNVKEALSFWEPKPNQQCMNCDTKFFGPEPRFCCATASADCGCMGMPIDPIICSEECYNQLLNLK